MDLNTYYTALSDLHGEHFTEKQFSRDYLGKSITYYGYLKCTNSKPSKAALINLYKALQKETHKCDEFAARSKFDWLVEEYKEHKHKLEGLASTLLQDIMYEAP